MIAECSSCAWVGRPRSRRVDKPCRKCGGVVVTRLSRSELIAMTDRGSDTKRATELLPSIVIAVAPYGRVLRVPTTTEQCEHLWPGRGW